MPEPYATCQSSDRRAGLSGGRHISNQDASMLCYLSEVVEGVEMPTRLLCACRCGCRRRPGRRIQCPREGCRRWVGPGCHPTPCWNPRTNSCHMCAQGNPQEPVGQATCGTMESLDELWQGLPEYCAPSRGTPLGPETAPVDAAKTRWFDDAPENIRRIAIATRAREEYEE